MYVFLKRNAPVFYMLVAMIVLYAPWMGRGYVNFEYASSMAARGLSDSRFADQLDVYFGIQANPLGYSFVLALIYKIFGYHDWFWLAKFPSLCGALMILVSGWVMTRVRWHDRRSLFYFWSSLIILHPMVIAYGTSATADVLPVGLVMLSLTIAFKSADHQIFFKFLAALLFGFAIIVKYNSAYFGLAFIYLAIVGRTQAKKSMAQIYRHISIFVIVPFIFLVTYIWWQYVHFQIFVSRGFTEGKPNFLDGTNWLLTIGMYLTFLGLFCGPISLAFVLKGVKSIVGLAKYFVIGAGLMSVGWFVFSTRVIGEMDFGGGFPFNQLTSQLLRTCGFLLGTSLAVFLTNQFRLRNVQIKFLLLGSIPYLMLISASRPTQRYLIFMIPVVLLLLVDASSALNIKIRNFTWGVTAVGFAAVLLAGMSYLRAQGNASENMAVWMEKNGVINQSSVGLMGVHAGQHFYDLEQNEIKYDVIATSLEGEKLIKERILHREPMNVLGRITRVYVLYELPKKP